jgi:hypothetical protein
MVVNPIFAVSIPAAEQLDADDGTAADGAEHAARLVPSPAAGLGLLAGGLGGGADVLEILLGPLECERGLATTLER